MHFLSYESLFVEYSAGIAVLLAARFGLSRVTCRHLHFARWFRGRFRKAKSAAGELPFPSFRGRACLNLWPTAHGKDHELCRWVYSSSVIDRLAAHRSYVPTTLRAVSWRLHRPAFCRVPYFVLYRNYVRVSLVYQEILTAVYN